MQLVSDLVDITIELKVYVLFSRFGFWLRRVCSSGFELSQFRGHNGFHPVHRFLCFEYKIGSASVPVPGCTPPRPPHHQRIRFGHDRSGQMVVMHFGGFRV